MKKKRIGMLAGVVLLSTIFLGACSSSTSNKESKHYSYVYGTDPESLDYLAAGRSSTTSITSNLIDGLLEYNRYGEIVPSLAESWEVSSDGLVYTYKLRKDAKWYTSEGEEYADVTAHDFVAGLKYAADKDASGLYVVKNSVKGLADYVSGANKDFNSVGIKAIDDYTVQYTLTKPEPYWNSKTTMTTLMPVNQEFLESKGDDFGKPEPDGILYNGPFILSELTTKSAIKYTKNPNYWDKDNVHLDTIQLSYISGKSSDQDNLAKNFAEGIYTSAALYPNSSNYASVEKDFKDNIIYGDLGGTTYYYGFNLNRLNYTHSNKTDAQKESAKKAILNKDFRQAITFAFDRENYSAQSNGSQGGKKNLRNILVPPLFVSLSNGETFGSLVEKELINYGEEWKNVDLDDEQNGLYHPDKAKTEFAKAKASLESQGVEFPIHLDLPVDQSNTDSVNQTSSLKQSIESVLGAENVVIDLQKMNVDDYDNATYFAETPEQFDWDLSANGWGPDYQDPSTYLEILNPSSGSAIRNIGLVAGKGGEAVTASGLDQYENLLKDADSSVTNEDDRYRKYAVAQAWLSDSAIVIPTFAKGGAPGLTRVKPFTSAFSYGVGVKDEKTFKYLEVQDEPVTTSQYNKAREEWLKERSK